MSDIVAFSDLLKVEGVNFKGFGLLPKYVMLDPDLTIEAKTIYAYFCSFAGSGNSAFPSRDKIISDLCINKDTYYKHYHLIINQGYIDVKQEIDGSAFGRNIYTLVSNPKKFKENPLDSKQSLVYSRIRFSGLKSAGFGMIPKAVMMDSRLPIKAKGIYAYFCSFTGSGNSAFPKLDKIIYHLQVAERTYYKYYKLLTELNYITAIQRHISGRLSVNDYYLNDTPDMEKAVKKAINHDICECNPISDDRLENLEIDVSQELLKSKILPLAFTKDLNRITTAIHFMTDWNILYPSGYMDQSEQQLYNLFNEALIKMCINPKMKLHGTMVTNKQVIEQINCCAVISKTYFNISHITDFAMEHYTVASKTQKIRNPLSYMQSCIWSALLTDGESDYII